MKFKIQTAISLSAIAIASILAFNNCGGGFVSSLSGGGSSSNASTSSITDPTGGGGGVTTPPSAIVAGNGGGQSGTGALSVPTGNAIVFRLKNGLGNSVSPLTGNFAKGLSQVASNLPKSTDPTKATGFDQAQLLVYAACSDLTTGGTPIMKSKYLVDPKAVLTAAATQTAIVTAAQTMLDQYTAGLASQSSASAAVSTALSNLVKQSAATTSNTTTMAFMTACIAANSAGSVLLGF